MNLIGKGPFSGSRLFLKRPPRQDTSTAIASSPLVGPLTAAAFIFLAACGCWENRCQECGSWEFIPARWEPLTSGCKCQLSVVREGDLRSMDSDRQASAGRARSPREKSWKEVDSYIHTLRPVRQLHAAALLREATLTSREHDLVPGLDSQEDASLCPRMFLEQNQLCVFCLVQG